MARLSLPTAEAVEAMIKGAEEVIDERKRQLKTLQALRRFLHRKESAERAVMVLRAYLGCSDVVRGHIQELLDILGDPDTDEDDYVMTLFTLLEALFGGDDCTAK
jgi:hypothetical protein